MSLASSSVRSCWSSMVQPARSTRAADAIRSRFMGAVRYYVLLRHVEGLGALACLVGSAGSRFPVPGSLCKRRGSDAEIVGNDLDAAAQSRHPATVGNR